MWEKENCVFNNLEPVNRSPPPPPAPQFAWPQEYNSVSLNLCFSNQNAPCVKVIWVFFQLLLCLLHLLWNILSCSLQNDTNGAGQWRHSTEQTWRVLWDACGNKSRACGLGRLPLRWNTGFSWKIGAHARTHTCSMAAKQNIAATSA